MSSGKIVREVSRVYQRYARQLSGTDPGLMRARHATVQRLCGPAAVAHRQAPESIESTLLQGDWGDVFSAVVRDEILLWQPPEGPTQLERLLTDRQLRTRPIARQFLETLSSSTLRLWQVIDTRADRWAIVRRFGGNETPRRVELLDDSKSIGAGDCVVARRIKLGGTRVFADGWLTFPDKASDMLIGLEGDAMIERALSLWALVRLGDRQATDRWLESLGGPQASRRGATGSNGHASGDPDRERLLERIRKLFAMAQETEASPHEAEIALRRCQSLMARFGISDADLETSEFGVVSVAAGRTVATHVKLLGGAVALLHDVIFVIGRGGLAEFRGYEIDVQVASMTFEYLVQAMERALSTRKKASKLPPGRSAAFDYRVAFAREVHERVRVIDIERDLAERAGSTTGTTLTIRKRDQLDREFGDDLVEKRMTLRRPKDDEAADAGRRDGQAVSLDPQIG